VVRSRARGTTLVAVIAATGLVGCAHADAAPPVVDPSSFSAAGPWADEFAESASDTSPYQRRILSDGTISAQEVADAQSRMSTCMRDVGYDYVTAEDGTSEASPLPGRKAEDAAAINDSKSKCAKEFDSDVTYLFNEVRRNPQKQDEAEITVACLRAARLVDDTYTEREWRTQNDDGNFSFSPWDPAAVQCRLDPLGLWRQ
jgi:hypothetical protein